jgi:hypothetical protein
MAPFSKSLSQAVLPGDVVVATATRVLFGNGGETSELSACVLVTGEAGPCLEPYPDFVTDSEIDAKDLLLLIEDIRQQGGLHDITGDLKTNAEDLLKFSLSWQGARCPSGE